MSAIGSGSVKTQYLNVGWRNIASPPSHWHECGMIYLLLVRFTRQGVTLSQSTKIFLSFHRAWAVCRPSQSRLLAGFSSVLLDDR